MLSFRNIGKVARQSRSEVELRRLTRQDLLQLLLDQMSETDRLHDELEAVKTGAADLGELTEHLKTRLDDKDAQIAHLQTKLNEKDALLRQALAYARENVGGGGAHRAFTRLSS